MMAYDDDDPTCIQTFGTLRFYHPVSSPRIVTEVLGIEPSESQEVGQARGGRYSPYRISGWFLSSEGEVVSKDVRCHIDWILDRVAGLEGAVQRLRSNGWESDVSCYWLGIGHGGPMLDPAQMSGLSKFGLTCEFDVYAA